MSSSDDPGDLATDSPPAVDADAGTTTSPSPTTRVQNVVAPEFGIELEIPLSWTEGSDGSASRTWEGEDGWVHVSAADALDGLPGVVDDLVNHQLEPFGSGPTVTEVVVDGAEGRLIVPSDDAPAPRGFPEAAIAIELAPGMTIGAGEFGVLTVYADTGHVESIADSIRFLESPPVSEPASTEPVWPPVVLASPNQRDVYIFDSVGGDILERFAPSNPDQTGVDGVSAGDGGRVALWATSNLTVFADGEVTTHEIPMGPRVESDTFEFRVEFVPGEPWVWVVQPGICCENTTPSRALIYDYSSDVVVATLDELRPNVVPRGVTQDGRLIGRYDTGSEVGTIVLAVAGDVIDVDEVDGEPIAVSSDGVIVERCDDVCVLSIVSLEMEEYLSEIAEVAVPTGLRVSTMSRAILPGGFGALPTRNPQGDAVLVGLSDAGEPEPRPVPWILDLEELTLAPTELGPDIHGAFWDCQGEGVAGITLDGIPATADGSHPSLPRIDHGLGIVVGTTGCVR